MWECTRGRWKDFEHSSISCPVRILKDKDHRIVDDCIGATVGGVKNYLRILKSVSDAGTYLFTPMYSKGWRELLDLNKLNKDPAKALELMKRPMKWLVTKELLRLILAQIHWKFRRFYSGICKMFDFEILEFEDGNQEIFKDCYKELKMEIEDKSKCWELLYLKYTVNGCITIHMISMKVSWKV